MFDFSLYVDAVLAWSYLAPPTVIDGHEMEKSLPGLSVSSLSYSPCASADYSISTQRSLVDGYNLTNQNLGLTGIQKELTVD